MLATQEDYTFDFGGNDGGMYQIFLPGQLDDPSSGLDWGLDNVYRLRVEFDTEEFVVSNTSLLLRELAAAGISIT